MARYRRHMDPTSRSDWTVDEFIEWAVRQPGRSRYELEAGDLVAMAPERVGHTRVRAAIFKALDASVRSRGLPCEALPDGVCVVVDEKTLYEPDVLVRCGEPLGDEETHITDPILVVEVLSPSTQAHDTGAKLEGYFRLPSVRHYLLAKMKNRALIHHRRGDEGSIATSIVREGSLVLDPPGLSLDLDAVWSVLR